MTSPTLEIKRQQQAWASQHGIAFDPSGYVCAVADNLFQPLSADTAYDFNRAQGGELDDSRGRAKMRALHSSSALGVNAFEYWRFRDAAPLMEALGVDPIARLEFEGRFPTGVSTPNLDVVLHTRDGAISAIESKFAEPYAGHQSTGLKQKYFDATSGRWERLGLAHCEELAVDITAGRIRYRWLHAEQLLKHILGLACDGREWELIYLWYSVSGPVTDAHLQEVRDFTAAVTADGIAFRAMTYQELFAVLAVVAGHANDQYLEYMRNRYLLGSI